MMVAVVVSLAVVVVVLVVVVARLAVALAKLVLVVDDVRDAIEDEQDARAAGLSIVRGMIAEDRGRVDRVVRTLNADGLR